MAVRPIDAMKFKQRMCALCNQDYADEPCEPSDCVFIRAINEAPTLTPPNEWVSVEERLPDKPGHYLVCTSINYWHGGCMDVNQEHKYHDSGTPVGYDGTTMSVLDCYYDITGDWNRVCNKHVTHWMPLPAPPDRRPPEGEEET